MIIDEFRKNHGYELEHWWEERFGQLGPYHHVRVAALQRLAREMGDGSSAENCKLNTDDCRHVWRILPVQIAACG